MGQQFQTVVLSPTILECPLVIVHGPQFFQAADKPELAQGFDNGAQLLPPSLSSKLQALSKLSWTESLLGQSAHFGLAVIWFVYMYARAKHALQVSLCQQGLWSLQVGKSLPSPSQYCS